MDAFWIALWAAEAAKNLENSGSTGKLYPELPIPEKLDDYLCKHEKLNEIFGWAVGIFIGLLPFALCLILFKFAGIW